MPRDISDSKSRKKDKLSSRDNLTKDYDKVYDAADEISKRKSAGKCSTDDRKLSKKSEASVQSSGRKRHFQEQDENCFASEYDDFEDSKKFVRNSMHQHSRNGLLLQGLSNKHSLVDYDDDESSDSVSLSESLSPQHPTGARRKSAVRVVSASVKADLNDMRQQGHQPDSTISRHVRVSSSLCKNKTDSANIDERSDRKKQSHSIAESAEPQYKTKDIPVTSSKSRHSKDHHGSRKRDEKDHVLTSDQTNCKKHSSVDKPEKTSDVKKGSKERDTKRTKRHDSETRVVSSDVHTEKSKAHKKSKKHEMSEEKWLDDDGMEQRSRTNVPKLSSASAAVHKKEKSQKVLDNSFSHSKDIENTDRLKKTDSHLDSINGTKSLSYGSSSVQQEDRALKLNSDDRIVHRKREKEKHSSRKKLRAAEDFDSDSEKEKKDRSALKHDTQSTSHKADKVKDKRSKNKVSRKEKEFSDEGQISSDSSGGRAKESKRKHQSVGTLRNRSSTPVRSSQKASASSRKDKPSELCQPERYASFYLCV